jgi:hypothetical protein
MADLPEPTCAAIVVIAAAAMLKSRRGLNYKGGRFNYS